MTPDEWVVIAGGLAAVAWVNWYFFGSSGSSAVATAAGHASEVEIVVEGGYAPREVRVPAGGVTRLVFDRRETSGCSEEVVIPDFGIRKFLPPHERTVVEIDPQAPGRYEFTCGMGMLRGRIVVEDRDADD